MLKPYGLCVMETVFSIDIHALRAKRSPLPLCEKESKDVSMLIKNTIVYELARFNPFAFFAPLRL